MLILCLDQEKLPLHWIFQQRQKTFCTRIRAFGPQRHPQMTARTSISPQRSGRADQRRHFQIRGSFWAAGAKFWLADIFSKPYPFQARICVSGPPRHPQMTVKGQYLLIWGESGDEFECMLTTISAESPLPIFWRIESDVSSFEWRLDLKFMLIL